MGKGGKTNEVRDEDLQSSRSSHHSPLCSSASLRRQRLRLRKDSKVWKQSLWQMGQGVNHTQVKEEADSTHVHLASTFKRLLPPKLTKEWWRQWGMVGS